MVLSASTFTKVVKELKDLKKNPIDGVKVIVNEDDVTDIRAEYEGPVGTPFERGLFKMKLILGDDFPTAPPRGVFLTKIFHPNVSEEGDICVNVLKRDWTPDTELRHVLEVVRCLLVEPNAESALNEDAGKLLLEGFDAFAARARIVTDVHARRPVPLADARAAANGVAGSARVSGKGEGGVKAAGTKQVARRGVRRL